MVDTTADEEVRDLKNKAHQIFQIFTQASKILAYESWGYDEYGRDFFIEIMTRAARLETFIESRGTRGK